LRLAAPPPVERPAPERQRHSQGISGFSAGLWQPL